jgi:hypothetical protein
MKKTSTKSRKASIQTRVSNLLQDLSGDPKLAPIVRDFENRAKLGETRKFGSNGLKINGKLFALFTQGTLVVKLPRDRVATLVTQGVGKPFDPGHGRLMRQWLTVVSTRASWSELAREAFRFVSGATR